jgi:D-alanine-D-alanine ligase
MNSSKIIAVLAGGDTGEYEISLSSAKMIHSCLKDAGFTPYIVLLRNGKWEVKDGESNHSYPLADTYFGFKSEAGEIRFSMAYNTCHGSPGEDGKLAGYLEMKHIPYSSSGVLASSLTMDKHLSKKLCATLQIPVAKDVLLSTRTDMIDIDEICDYLGLPCFVKPNTGGSSLATFKVKQKSEMMAAIEAAFEVDNAVLIEEFLPGRELTIGVFHNGEYCLTLPPTEIISHNEFFDYQAKYDGASDEITPAAISERTLEQLEEYASEIYELFRLDGLVRIDFMLSEDELYFMEVNTIPGFSPASIVPQQIRAAGLKESDVLTALLAQTEARFKDRWNAAE